MDPATFDSFQTQLSKEHFSDGQLGVVRSFALNHWFSGYQVVAALKSMDFPSTQLLEIMAPRMMPLSGQEGRLIVEEFVHSKDKLKAVEIIANHINDPVNKYVVLDAVDFHFDKEKARKILDQAVFTPNPHHHHHHHHHPPACTSQSYSDPIPQGGFNISFNTGLGIPGFSASFAGGAPRQHYQQQQQPSYPGYSAPQQPRYPAPQQPGYPPPQQPGYPPPQQPGYPPPQQPGYPPPQQPGYPPPQQPGYPPPQQPGYPPPQQPGYPPSGYPPPQGYPYPSYP